MKLFDAVPNELFNIMEQLKKVVFIENKTNYDEYLLSQMKPDELVFYHGGFLSPQKRKFLKVLEKSILEEE